MAFFSEITRSKPLLLIGAGQMGGALLKGWLRAGLSTEAVIVVDPRGREEIRNSLGVDQLRVFESLAAMGAINPPRIVVFAVKPQFMADVFDLAGHIPLQETLLLSIAAGTRIRVFEKQFGKDTAIIRAMPNTPAAVGKGISAVIGNKAASDEDISLAEGLFSCVGEVVRVTSEDALDAVTALSGSGPAYFFYMVEAIAEAGLKAGLEPEAAMKLARETFTGSAALLEASGEEAAALRQKVTSPGGTTEAALSILMADGGLKALMEKAILKAMARSKELSS